jgi:hypothetical protein
MDLKTKNRVRRVIFSLGSKVEGLTLKRRQRFSYISRVRGRIGNRSHRRKN